MTRFAVVLVVLVSIRGILADLNGDGRLDLVARHVLSRRVTVLLGDGKGGGSISSKSMTTEVSMRPRP